MSGPDGSAWSELEELWRGDASREAEESLRRLGARVRRRARLLRWLAAGELATGALFVALAVHLLRRFGGSVGWVTFAALVAFVLAATSFAWWNRRGLWRAAGKRPDDYLALEGRQLEARLRGVRFGFWLLAAEVAFFVVWIPWARPGDLLVRYAFLLAWSAPFAAALYWLDRRTRGAARALERLRREFQGAPGA